MVAAWFDPAYQEHRLHSDHGEGDVVFYFTTCGWMMWNWLVSAIAVKAVIVLYEGNPFFPGPERLWQMAASEKLDTFGTSAKFIDATRKSGYRPCEDVDLTNLKRICSTGSPLTEDGFGFVYDSIKSDLHLASISGGRIWFHALCWGRRLCLSIKGKFKRVD